MRNNLSISRRREHLLLGNINMIAMEKGFMLLVVITMCSWLKFIMLFDTYGVIPVLFLSDASCESSSKHDLKPVDILMCYLRTSELSV